jgi:hypothetical protein
LGLAQKSPQGAGQSDKRKGGTKKAARKPLSLNPMALRLIAKPNQALPNPAIRNQMWAILPLDIFALNVCIKTSLA